MSYNETTITGSNSFPVIDVTHKPKRRQGDMIRIKNSVDSGAEKSPETSHAPLKVITLERAVKYYESLSNDPDNGALYQATAEWLRELLVTRTLKTEQAVKSLREKESTDDGNSDKIDS